MRKIRILLILLFYFSFFASYRNRSVAFFRLHKTRLPESFTHCLPFAFTFTIILYKSVIEQTRQKTVIFRHLPSITVEKFVVLSPV